MVASDAWKFHCGRCHSCRWYRRIQPVHPILLPTPHRSHNCCSCIVSAAAVAVQAAVAIAAVAIVLMFLCLCFLIITAVMRTLPRSCLTPRRLPPVHRLHHPSPSPAAPRLLLVAAVVAAAAAAAAAAVALPCGPGPCRHSAESGTAAMRIWLPATGCATPAAYAMQIDTARELAVGGVCGGWKAGVGCKSMSQTAAVGGWLRVAGGVADILPTHATCCFRQRRTNNTLACSSIWGGGAPMGTCSPASAAARSVRVAGVASRVRAGSRDNKGMASCNGWCGDTVGWVVWCGMAWLVLFG